MTTPRDIRQVIAAGQAAVSGQEAATAAVLNAAAIASLSTEPGPAAIPATPGGPPAASQGAPGG